jgi:hypothetical protein
MQHGLEGDGRQAILTNPNRKRAASDELDDSSLFSRPRFSHGSILPDGIERLFVRRNSALETRFGGFRRLQCRKKKKKKKKHKKKKRRMGGANDNNDSSFCLQRLSMADQQQQPSSLPSSRIDDGSGMENRWRDIDRLLLRSGNLVGPGFEPGPEVTYVNLFPEVDRLAIPLFFFFLSFFFFSKGSRWVTFSFLVTRRPWSE